MLKATYFDRDTADAAANQFRGDPSLNVMVVTEEIPNTLICGYKAICYNVIVQRKQDLFN